jgi:hypothetical protein
MTREDLLAALISTHRSTALPINTLPAAASVDLGKGLNSSSRENERERESGDEA